MSIILFIIILAILVFVHELGHFLAAKSAGIRVDEFGIGFPPKIFSFKKGETTYALNAIPFGGYVKIFGENPDEESISGPEKARSFVHKPKYIQIYVLAAGVIFNIIFAWLLLSFGFMIGMPAPQNYTVDGKNTAISMTISAVAENSPASRAGIETGDIITRIQAPDTQLELFSIQDIQEFTAAHSNQPITLSVLRNGVTQEKTVTPEISPNNDRATMGVGLGVIGILKLPFFSAFLGGAALTYDMTTSTIVGLGDFFLQIFKGQADFSDVAGPVGIARIVGDASHLGFIVVAAFTALISINLAVINLIPFPALDGGRILFAIIEKIKGSAIKPQIANTVNSIGFLLLILLMLIITYHDIYNIFKG